LHVPGAANTLTTSARERDVVQQALHKTIKSCGHDLALFATRFRTDGRWLVALLDVHCVRILEAAIEASKIWQVESSISSVG
jgi:hypothetical protein